MLHAPGRPHLSLEERTAIAESVGGDLFVSLHANAAPRRSVAGIETYYLDANHERHSLGVAARENGVPRSQVDALQRTIAKLRVSEVSVHSRRAANTVHQQMVSGLAGRYREVNDLGVKKGPFYVLFLSNMPAILVEAGFLTNRDEARRVCATSTISTSWRGRSRSGSRAIATRTPPSPWERAQ